MKKPSICERRICRGCIYSSYLNGWRVCDYIQITGKRRPCPAGVGCTVRVSMNGDEAGAPVTARKRQDQKPNGRKPKWDYSKAEEMLKQGLSPKEIAVAMGISPDHLRKCFRQHGVELPRAKAGPAYTWDVERGRKLYQQGKTAKEIAQALGTRPETVHAWMRKQGLSPNRRST